MLEASICVGKTVKNCFNFFLVSANWFIYVYTWPLSFFVATGDKKNQTIAGHIYWEAAVLIQPSTRQLVNSWIPIHPVLHPKWGEAHPQWLSCYCSAYGVLPSPQLIQLCVRICKINPIAKTNVGYSNLSKWKAPISPNFQNFVGAPVSPNFKMNQVSISPNFLNRRHFDLFFTF